MDERIGCVFLCLWNLFFGNLEIVYDRIAYEKKYHYHIGDATDAHVYDPDCTTRPVLLHPQEITCILSRVRMDLCGLGHRFLSSRTFQFGNTDIV